MLEETFVQDIQQEIRDIQTNLKALNDEAIEFNSFAAHCDEKSDDIKVSFTSESMQIDQKSKIVNVIETVKDEPDLIPASVEHFDATTVNKPINHTSMSTPSSMMIDEKPVIGDVLHKELNYDSSYSCDRMAQSTIAKSSKYHQQHAMKFDVKKEEIENFDIESEITPSYIIKNKCEPMRQPICASTSTPTTTMSSSVASTTVTTATAAAAAVTNTNTNMNNIFRETISLNAADFDYLCNSGVPSMPSASSNSSNINENASTGNRKKDELIACDKEPYDEWFCIQKELSLITDKRPNEHNIIDGFIDTKLGVENHFPDLFANDHPSNQHEHLDGDRDLVGSHSPLSELFNDSIVSNSVNDKSVENRLENMFSDSSEFEKTNDLVESRLEELFHGSSPTQATPSTQSTPPAGASQPTMNSQSFMSAHVANHSEFMMVQQSSNVQLTSNSSTPQSNKRHWQNNGDIISQISPTQLHPSKRSCMMSSFMESTQTTDDHQWMMECQQSQTSYDFMSTGDANLDASATSKRLWNGTTSNCDVTAGDNVINGVLSSCDAMGNMKKDCYGDMKNHDLERDLLGLGQHGASTSLDAAGNVLMHVAQNHMHADNSYSSSSMHGANSDNGTTAANTSNNSMSSNFEDDINRHVQNAIDSILNLQNSENDTLQYLDHTMGSFLSDGDGPLSSTSTSSYAHSANVNALGVNGPIRSTQGHMMHQTMHLNHQQSTHGVHFMGPHKRRSNHFDDSGDCLISGGRGMDHNSGNVTGVDMMIDSPPTLDQTNNPITASSNLADFMSMDDPVKSIITS